MDAMQHEKKMAATLLQVTKIEITFIIGVYKMLHA